MSETMPAAVAADAPPSAIAAVAAEDGEEHPSSPPLPLPVSGVSPVSDSDKFIVLGGRKIVKKKKRKCVKCEYISTLLRMVSKMCRDLCNLFDLRCYSSGLMKSRLLAAVFARFTAISAPSVFRSDTRNLSRR